MTNQDELGESGAGSAPVLPEPVQILGTFSRARPISLRDTAQSAADGQVVKVVGKAAPGAGGTLRAPLSGAECVWYRSIVFRQLRESGFTTYRQRPLRPLNPLAPSDLPDYGVAHRVDLRGQRLGSDTSSTQPFALADGASSVVVDPQTSDIDTDIFAVNKVISRGGGGLQFKGGTFGSSEVHAEWIIPVGADLLAVGTVRQNSAGSAELVAIGDDIVLVSTKPEQQILSRNETATQAGARLPVASPRSAVVLLGTLMAIAAVVAVVLFIVLSR